MLRFSLIVCLSLIFGITAKPFKPGNKLTDEAYQDVVVSMDDKGKMSWGVEVEPPEDLDETDFAIDPRMKIWKNMMSSGQNKPLKAGEDSDKLFHPSMTDLIKFQMQNQGVSAFLSASEHSQKDDSLKLTEDSDKLLHSSVSDLLKMRIQNQGVSAFLSAAEPSQKDANMKSYQEPEEDRDDIDHPAFSDSLKEPEQDWEKVVHEYLAPLTAQNKGGAKVHVVHSEPEMDKDDLYHPNFQPVQMEPLGREVVGENAAARVEEPFQRKYNEPEEDLDDLYH
ncbi:uncharacterized protein si:ch211-217g15.3 [Larimichthys crocea]|uniref:uncharacterized protein si:ch211-217g15.3 n=1 Tax=Larimichthys crocea TaxID=215358 RepID=UPI00054B0E1C|nr:uncharacterized protein LOC104924257 [Larimichthys crocea]XP_027133163.1 uncharacterized protein LOC104924257 [Larimichthys crocea]